MKTKNQLLRFLLCIGLICILFTVHISSALATSPNDIHDLPFSFTSLLQQKEAHTGTPFSAETLEEIPSLAEHEALKDQLLEWNAEALVYEARALDDNQGNIWVTYHHQSAQWYLTGVNSGTTDFEYVLRDEFGERIVLNWIKTMDTLLEESLVDDGVDKLSLKKDSIFQAQIGELKIDNYQQTPENPSETENETTSGNEKDTSGSNPEENTENPSNDVPIEREEIETDTDTTGVASLNSGRSNRSFGIASTGPASLTGYKKAERVSGENDTFKVTLDVTGTPKITSTQERVPVDVVLALDLSGSMGSGLFSNWDYLAKSSKSIIQMLLDSSNPEDADLDIRVGMVGYASFTDVRGTIAHKPLHGLTRDHKDLTSLFNLTYNGMLTHPGSLRSSDIGGIQLGTGTNSQGGFMAAQEMLDQRSATDKDKRKAIIIFLSDGMTERHYSSTPSSGGYYNEVVSSDISQALAVANQNKSVGSTIYTVGFYESKYNALPSEAVALLSAAASDSSKFSAVPRDNLQEKLGDIGQEIKETRWVTDHSHVAITDPMSEYVTLLENGYGGERIHMEVTKNHGLSWDSLPTTDWNMYIYPSPQALQVTISNYTSDYQYRLVYHVKLKSEHYGKAIHQDQTSGRYPAPGKSGVIANGYTYLSSDLVTQQEVMVPTVYTPLTEVAKMTTKKVAFDLQREDLDPSLGFWGISLTFNDDHDDQKLPITDVILYDPMSDYVEYVPGSSASGDFPELVGMRAKKGIGSWELTYAQPIYEMNSRTISWALGNTYDDDYVYLMKYTVMVKEEYLDVRIHKDQTNGNYPEWGTDGVITNARTYLSYEQNSTRKEQDILVPAVVRITYEDLMFTKFYTDHQGDEQPLQGAKFELRRCLNPYQHVHTDTSNCWSEATEKVSLQDGLVVFPTLRTGQYLLKETEAPFGFQRPNGYWIVTIYGMNDFSFKGYATNGSMPPAIKVDSNGKFRIPNFYLYGLPLSGQKGILIFLVTGFIITISGILAYRFKKNKIRRNTYE